MYGGDLLGPIGYLQMVTLGSNKFLAAFAKPGQVDKEDMVIWNPEDSTWNQNFPDDTGDTWPARFGATVVSLEVICPAN